MAAPKGNKYYLLVKNWQFGNHAKYTPEDLWAKFIDYVRWVESSPLQEQVVFGTGFSTSVNKVRAMTIKGFCTYAQIDRTTYYDYAKRQDYAHIIARIEDAMYMHKFENAAAGLLNANIIARELQLADKVDSTVREEKVIKGLSKDQIAEILSDDE